MSNAWLSSFSTLPVTLVLGEDTIRGGLLLVLAQNALLLDPSRDQSFLSLTLPAGWTSVSSGSGSVKATRDGLKLDSGVVAGSVAGLQTPDDYGRFDVAVDVELVFPVGGQPSVVDLAVLEARTISGAVARVRLRRGFGSDPARTVVFGDFTIGGVTTTGGIEFAPDGPLTLRIVRNGARIFGFVGVRDVSGRYTTLVKVIDYDRFPVDGGKIRLYLGNVGLAKRVVSTFANFTVRSHSTIAGRLLNNKLDISARRIVGNVPAATLEEVGLVDLSIFGLFGELKFTNGFRYVLPPEKTLGRQSPRTLFTVQDPVLRDGT